MDGPMNGTSFLAYVEELLHESSLNNHLSTLKELSRQGRY
jgi:hypothetical protein